MHVSIKIKRKWISSLIFIIVVICYNQLQKYLRHCTVFWHKWPVHDLVLVIPLHPLSKLLAIQDHTQNLEEQLWMGGRREVSIIFYRPVTRSDLKQERSFFRVSVSSYLQLVVASLRWIIIIIIIFLQRKSAFIISVKKKTMYPS